MTLKSRIVGLIAVVFVVVFAGAYALFGWLRHDLLLGIGTEYAKKQVLYNRERTLHPLMRELALARKLADSSAVKAWARDESDPALRTAALRELEEYRRFFADRSFFCVVHASGNYYFNDRDDRYRGRELRYTLDPADPENRWYFGTVASDAPYRLNVDYDEELRVTKVWLNVVMRDGDRPLGIVGTGLDLTPFLAAVVASDHPGVSNMFVDESGAIQAHDRVELIDFRSISRAPSERKTAFQLLDQEVDRDLLRGAMDDLREGPAGAVEVLIADQAGQQHLIGLTYLAEIGWYNVTLVDAERIVGGQGVISFALLLLVALVTLSVAVVLVLNRVLLRRITRLDEFVREFAGGTTPSPPAQAGRDEMGRLEEGFRQMACGVREQAERLEDRVASRTEELAAKNQKLQRALAEIRTLSGLLPTCMYCKKIRDQEGRWNHIEAYISQRTDAQFSHGVCPECLERAYAEAGQEPSPEG
jgi:HAMP domain-containing protein